MAFGRSPSSKRDTVRTECNLSRVTALFVCFLISCPTVPLHFACQTLPRRKWAPQVWLVEFTALFSLPAKRPNNHLLKRNSCVTFIQVGVRAGRRCYWSDTMEVVQVSAFSSHWITLHSFRATPIVSFLILPVWLPECEATWRLFPQSAPLPVCWFIHTHTFADFHSLVQVIRLPSWGKNNNKEVQ